MNSAAGAWHPSFWIGHGQVQEQLDGKTATFRLPAASFTTMKQLDLIFRHYVK